MNVRDRVTLWRLERRLRKLQDAYYDAGKKDESVIVEYFRTLEAARMQYLASHHGPRHRARLHLGSGDHHIANWINVDFSPMMNVEVAADLTREMPFRSASIDLIHSEDFIEHVDEAAGKLVLRECHRILRTGGVMRLLTPDLRALIEEVYVRRDPRHLRWCGVNLDSDDPCSALNMHMRMGGEHRFIYDGEHLTSLLRETGFHVRRVRYNASPVPELRFLDLRDFGLNLFLEAVKR
jgi:predicted SAM-dependent methyltransferase